MLHQGLWPRGRGRPKLSGCLSCPYPLKLGRSRRGICTSLGMRQCVMIAMACPASSSRYRRRTGRQRALDDHSGADPPAHPAAAGRDGHGNIFITHDMGVVAEVGR